MGVAEGVAGIAQPGGDGVPGQRSAVPAQLVADGSGSVL